MSNLAVLKRLVTALAVVGGLGACGGGLAVFALRFPELRVRVTARAAVFCGVPGVPAFASEVFGGISSGGGHFSTFANDEMCERRRRGALRLRAFVICPRLLLLLALAPLLLLLALAPVAPLIIIVGAAPVGLLVA